MAKKRWLPKSVSEFRDRHGKSRYRFRRKGFRQYLFKYAPGTEGFREEFEACKQGFAAEMIQPGVDRIVPGTFDDLITRYYRSPDFLDPSERTRVVYRGVIERWRVQFGDRKVHDLEAPRFPNDGRYVAASDGSQHAPQASECAYGVRDPEGMAMVNPVTATKPYKVESEGFHAWSEDEITLYEARRPIGTKARLALDLMLWTGQRGGDARVMGPGHIRNKRIIVTQEKTGVTVSLPILPALARSIMATRSGGLIFLLSEHGKPFSRKGFGNKMRQWCDEAGLPKCSAHGLRKAAARRFAEAGCSNQQIRAWTGHTTDTEVARYTAAADQQALSDAAAEMLMANLAKGLANDDDNLLEKGA